MLEPRAGKTIEDLEVTGILLGIMKQHFMVIRQSGGAGMSSQVNITDNDTMIRLPKLSPIASATQDELVVSMEAFKKGHLKEESIFLKDIHGRETEIKLMEKKSINVEKVAKANRPPLNIQEALDELRKDKELSLWHAEVAYHDWKPGADNTLDARTYIVAAKSREEAKDKAIQCAKDRATDTDRVVFTTFGASTVDPNDYEWGFTRD